MRQSIRPAKANRSSFTLLELLVVIAIIAVLISLTASAVIRFITTQEIRNTDATINKLEKELDGQVKSVYNFALKENPCNVAQELAGGDPAAGVAAEAARARVIHAKLRLKQEFPMSYFEVYYPVVDPFLGTPDPTMPPIKEYTDKLDPLVKAGVITINGNAPPTQDEVSACLAMALERHRGGKGTNLEDLLGAGVIGKNAGGLRIINDAWGQPIVFYRWPTANGDVDASGSDLNSVSQSVPQRRDTQDPEGKLQDVNWSVNSGLRPYFEFVCHSVSDPTTGQPRAYYIPPVVASGGPNQKLGIAFPNAIRPNPMAVAVPDDANDNLYSYRLRQGGKGD